MIKVLIHLSTHTSKTYFQINSPKKHCEHLHTPNTNTPTHTHTYICVCVRVCVRVPVYSCLHCQRFFRTSIKLIPGRFELLRNRIFIFFFCCQKSKISWYCPLLCFSWQEVCENNSYLFAYLWLEACIIFTITVPTLWKTFVSGWISYLSVPYGNTTDRDSDFESDKFTQLIIVNASRKYLSHMTSLRVKWPCGTLQPNNLKEVCFWFRIW